MASKDQQTTGEAPVDDAPNGEVQAGAQSSTEQLDAMAKSMQEAEDAVVQSLENVKAAVENMTSTPPQPSSSTGE